MGLEGPDFLFDLERGRKLKDEGTVAALRDVEVGEPADELAPVIGDTDSSLEDDGTMIVVDGAVVVVEGQQVQVLAVVDGLSPVLTCGSHEQTHERPCGGVDGEIGESITPMLLNPATSGLDAFNDLGVVRGEVSRVDVHDELGEVGQERGHTVKGHEIKDHGPMPPASVPLKGILKGGLEDGTPSRHF